MTEIQAIYQNGTLKFIDPTPFQENERVSVQCDRTAEGKAVARVHRNSLAVEMKDWIKETSEFREQLREKYGTLDDSTAIIAEDRMRDV